MTNEQENKCHAIIHSHLPTASSVSSFPSPCPIPQVRPNDREIVHTLFRPSLALAQAEKARLQNVDAA